MRPEIYRHLDQMRRFFTALTLALAALSMQSSERLSIGELVFLTRDGCVPTAQMRTALDAALKALALPTNYTVINLDKVKPSDIRTAYGTPTVLYKGRDLFGKAVPTQAGPPS